MLPVLTLDLHQILVMFDLKLESYITKLLCLLGRVFSSCNEGGIENAIALLLPVD